MLNILKISRLKNTKLKAFNMLETAFAILLIGIFTSMIIPYWQFLNTKQNIIVTQIRANYIRKAMEGYVMRYGFLPNAAVDTNGDETQGVHKGFVPYKTLGIPKSYIYDGFGKLFTFIVNEYLTLYKNDDRRTGHTGALPIHTPTFVPHIAKGGMIYSFLGSHFCKLHKYKIPNENIQSDNIEFSEIKSVTDIKTMISDYEQDTLCTNNKLIITKNNKNIINNDKKIHKFTMYKIVQRFEPSVQAMLETINKHEPKVEIVFDMKTEGDSNKTLFSEVLNDTKPSAADLKITKLSELLKRRKSIDKPYLEEVGNNCDAISWILISHSKRKNKYTTQNKTNEHVFTIDGPDLVFYQTRFNLAGQLNHPCSSNADIVLAIGIEWFTPAKIIEKFTK